MDIIQRQTMNDNNNDDDLKKIDKTVSKEVQRLRELFSKSQLLHPYLPAEYFKTNDIQNHDTTKKIINFTDLSAVLAECCGAIHNTTEEETKRRNCLKDKIYNQTKEPPRHIIVILCDGLGSHILNQRFSFLKQCDDISLRSVFPSTTPTALSTFATAVWPLQHGIVGWDLKDRKHCQFPSQTQDSVQIRILDKCFIDASTGKALKQLNYSHKDIFMAVPWIDKIENHHRDMYYINAYNGDEFQNWYQETKASPASEFSSWQRGNNAHSKTITIGETDFSKIGTNEGTNQTIQDFQKALNAIHLSSKPSFTYIYTAHPDKHMHKLGTNHPEIHNVIEGFSNCLEAFWDKVKGIEDVALIVTADHGHVTVEKEDMVVLPDEVLECLDYANIGVHGKGRHAYLHCKSGLQTILLKRWNQNKTLTNNFILLSIHEAIAEGLFGPRCCDDVRILQRLGDYVAISVNECTLVTDVEYERYDVGQGAHGSLLPQEVDIPFILYKS